MTAIQEQDWLSDILTNYEFQIIAMSDDDTGEQQRAEAKAAIEAHMQAVVKEVIGENDLSPDMYHIAKWRNKLRAEQRQRFTQLTSLDTNPQQKGGE